MGSHHRCSRGAIHGRGRARRGAVIVRAVRLRPCGPFRLPACAWPAQDYNCAQSKKNARDVAAVRAHGLRGRSARQGQCRQLRAVRNCRGRLGSFYVRQILSIAVIVSEKRAVFCSIYHAVQMVVKPLTVENRVSRQRRSQLAPRTQSNLE